jgi:hypothetical protein
MTPHYAPTPGTAVMTAGGTAATTAGEPELAPAPPALREAVDAVYYALFRVVAVADLAGPMAAAEWAQSLMDDPQLLEAFAAGVRQRLDSAAVRMADRD